MLLILSLKVNSKVNCDEIIASVYATDVWRYVQENFQLQFEVDSIFNF